MYLIYELYWTSFLNCIECVFTKKAVVLILQQQYVLLILTLLFENLHSSCCIVFCLGTRLEMHTRKQYTTLTRCNHLLLRINIFSIMCNHSVFNNKRVEALTYENNNVYEYNIYNHFFNFIHVSSWASSRLHTTHTSHSQLENQ